MNSQGESIVFDTPLSSDVLFEHTQIALMPYSDMLIYTYTAAWSIVCLVLVAQFVRSYYRQHYPQEASRS